MMHPDSVALIGLLLLLIAILINLAHVRRARRLRQNYLRSMYQRMMKDNIFCKRQAD
jgi:hypothetical protein